MHAFQLDNDAVYFLYRSAGDAPDQRIPVFGGRDTGRVFVAQATDDFMDIRHASPPAADVWIGFYQS
jgi:hypothetical protein